MRMRHAGRPESKPSVPEFFDGLIKRDGFLVFGDRIIGTNIFKFLEDQFPLGFAQDDGLALFLVINDVSWMYGYHDIPPIRWNYIAIPIFSK